MTDKIMHIYLKDVCPDEDNPMRFTTRLYADVVDMTDNLIVDACVKEARKAGINDVYLLDRKFVLDALREKIQETQREKFLLDKIKQLEAERDDLLEGMKQAMGCRACKHYDDDAEYVGNECMDCSKYCNWEWRGVQKEE